MSKRNYIAESLAIAQRKRLQSTDPKTYVIHIWMMFIAADLLEASVTEVKSILSLDNQFLQEDKHHINAILYHSSKFVKDVDRTCTEKFAEKFGDYADECASLLRAYMSNQINKMENIFAESKEVH